MPCRRRYPPPKPADGAPAFDIARIDPNGTSVFAGRAEPNSAVTITADGKEIGTAQADENGEWTFTTDEKIANPDAKLALFKAPAGRRPGRRGCAAGRRDVKTARARPRRQAKSAEAVTSKMIKNLEGMVAEARTEESKQAAAARLPRRRQAGRSRRCRNPAPSEGAATPPQQAAHCRADPVSRRTHGSRPRHLRLQRGQADRRRAEGRRPAARISAASSASPR